MTPLEELLIDCMEKQNKALRELADALDDLLKTINENKR